MKYAQHRSLFAAALLDDEKPCNRYLLLHSARVQDYAYTLREQSENLIFIA